MSSRSEVFRDCPSQLSTVRRHPREQLEAMSEDALSTCSVESTVVLPGSYELRAARYEEPNLGSTGGGLAISIPVPAAQYDTMKIRRGERARKPRLAFHVALTVAMLGVTIGILSGQAMPTGMRGAATTTSPASTTSPTPPARPAAEPRTPTSEKTPLEGATRGKAVKPARPQAMPVVVVRRPATSPSSSGPTAAELDESLSALSEAQAARPF